MEKKHVYFAKPTHQTLLCEKTRKTILIVIVRSIDVHLDHTPLNKQIRINYVSMKSYQFVQLSRFEAISIHNYN